MGHKTFNQTIEEIDYGAVHEELTAKLHELTYAVNSPGKTGELHFKIKMKGKQGGKVEIGHDVNLKLPKTVRESSIMFITVDGNIQARDPAQRDLPGMVVVGSEKAPVVAMPVETAAPMPVQVGAGGGAASITRVG